MHAPLIEPAYSNGFLNTYFLETACYLMLLVLTEKKSAVRFTHCVIAKHDKHDNIQSTAELVRIKSTIL